MEYVQGQTIDELHSLIEWLGLEKEYRLGEKDKEYSDRIQNIIQNSVQDAEVLKEEIQVLIKEKEDQEVSHKKELTEVKENHAEELKELKLRNAECMKERLERQNELQKKIETMQQKIEEVKKELHGAKESHLYALEENKQAHEAMMHELKAKLEEEVKNSEKKLREVQEDAESEIMELCLNYERDLQAEKATKIGIEDEFGIMKKNDPKLKSKIKDQGDMIREQEHEKQKLMNQLKDEKKSITDLNNEIKQQSQTISAKEHDIEKLRETIKHLKMTCETNQAELVNMNLLQQMGEEESVKSNKERLELERLTKELKETQETFTSTLAGFDLTRNRLETLSTDQRAKLKAMHQALITERQKVVDMNALVHRMKADLVYCTRFLHDPKKLKKNFMRLHACHIHGDVEIGAEDEIIKEHTKRMERFQWILEAEKRRGNKLIKLEEDRGDRLVRENSFWIGQINKQILREQKQLPGLKVMNAQSVNNARSCAPDPSEPEAKEQSAEFSRP